jgi:hypothetical protein
MAKESGSRLDEAFEGLDDIVVESGILKPSTLPTMTLTPIAECPAVGKGGGSDQDPKGFKAPYVGGRAGSNCAIRLSNLRQSVSFSVWPIAQPKGIDPALLAWPEAVKEALRSLHPGGKPVVYFTDDSGHIMSTAYPSSTGEIVKYVSEGSTKTFVRGIYVQNCGFDSFMLGSVPARD